jgi:hypothetical protein
MKRKPVLTLRVNGEGFKVGRTQSKARIVTWFSKVRG